MFLSARELKHRAFGTNVSGIYSWTLIFTKSKVRLWANSACNYIMGYIDTSWTRVVPIGVRFQSGGDGLSG